MGIRLSIGDSVNQEGTMPINMGRCQRFLEQDVHASMRTVTLTDAFYVWQQLHNLVALSQLIKHLDVPRQWADLSNGV